MSNDVKIKICGITSVEDGLAAASAGADAVGFVFSPASPRFVPLETAAGIASRLPPDLMRVGVFVDAPADVVAAAIQRCGLSLAQFHGQEAPEFCGQFGVMTMKAFRMRTPASLDEIGAYQVDAILLDSYAPDQPGGTGASFNWKLTLEAKKFGKPIFLAGGLTPENVAEAIHQARPFGVDVSSGVERSPGKKDPDKVRRFIAAARGAF
jgi:phosphoribosylanthranilate isomerase